MSFPRPYLVDTTVLIDVSRGRQPAFSWLEETILHLGQVCVSTVAIGEFFSGVRPEQRASSRVFIERLTHWDVTTEIALRAGELRYDLARQGRALLIADALIAATAITYGAVLVTANVRDFSRLGIAGISLAPS